MSRTERIGWIVGAIGIAVSALAWAIRPQEFAYGWLAALFTWSFWPLGGMALLYCHALTGGRWGEAARPGLMLGVVTMPLIILAALPVLFLFFDLYPWSHPDVAQHLRNVWYLNENFFVGRTLGYIVTWLVLAAILVLGWGNRWTAPPALILLAISITLSAIDATLSLDPRFKSSAYGMVTASEMAVLASAVAVLFAAPWAEENALADLAKILLSMLMLWAYLEFVQLLIVWNSNLANEAPWYARRMHGFWGGMLTGIAIVHFFIPFFFLVFPQVQRNRRMMMAIAALIVMMVGIRSWWIVLPAYPRVINWVDIACMAGLGGVALGLALRIAAIWRLAPKALAHV